MARLCISNVRLGTLWFSEATQQLASSLPVCQDADHIILVGRDSSANIVNRYGLEGPINESRGGEFFLTRPHQHWGRPSLLCSGYRVVPRCKAVGAWR